MLTHDEASKINSLLNSRGFTQISVGIVTRVHYKVKLRGKCYFAQLNRRVKKRNSYTIAYSSCFKPINYGLIEKFIVLMNHNIAIVKNVKVNSIGSSEIERALLEDYLQYEEGEICCIFVHQIIEKCFNLTNNGLNLLAFPVNNVEFE